MATVGEQQLCDQLSNLGLRAGDVAIVRVGFRNLGDLVPPGNQTLVRALLDVLGPHGTLLAFTHSPIQWVFRRDRRYIFDPQTAPCTTGLFADTVLRWPGAVRSSHPTCSM